MRRYSNQHHRLCGCGPYLVLSDPILLRVARFRLLDTNELVNHQCTNVAKLRRVIVDGLFDGRENVAIWSDHNKKGPI